MPQQEGLSKALKCDYRVSRLMIKIPCRENQKQYSNLQVYVNTFYKSKNYYYKII